MPEEFLYIGCKLIRAYRMDKDGVDGYHVTYPDGYESWSPKETFELAYRRVTEQEEAFINWVCEEKVT